VQLSKLNHGSFVLLYFALFAFSELCLLKMPLNPNHPSIHPSELYLVCVFSCTVLFVSIS